MGGGLCYTTIKSSAVTSKSTSHSRVVIDMILCVAGQCFDSDSKGYVMSYCTQAAINSAAAHTKLSELDQCSRCSIFLSVQ